MSVLIQKVTLRNFKTYNDQRTIEFRKSFTALCGLNGSGKSNFIDALLFAIGATLKHLRISNYSELVHKSPNDEIDSCSVEILMGRNDEETTSFRRTFDKSNHSNSYFVNRELVHIDEYKNQLSNFGIDVTLKYNVVFQGAVTNLIDQTTLQRTAYFEDICGSSQLKKNCTRLEKIAERAVLELKLVQKSHKDLFKELKDLNKKKKDVSAYESSKSKYVQEAVNISLYKLYVIEDTIAKAMKDYILTDEKAMTFAVEAKKTKAEHLAELASKKNQVILSKMELEFIQDEENKLSLKQEQRHKILETEAQAKMDHITRKINDLEPGLNRRKKAHGESLKIISDLQKQKKEVEDMLEVFGSESFASQFDFDENQVAMYSALKMKADSETFQFRNALDLNLQDQVSLKCNLDTLKIKLASDEKELDNISFLLEKLNQKIDNRRQSVISTQNIEKTMTNLVSRKEELDRRAEVLRNEIDTVKLNHYEKQKRAKHKKMDDELTKRFGSKIHGRLSHLCKPIADKYTIAMTKLLLPNMDAYVVDTSTTARACIELIKTQQLGVAKFLPLDDIKAVPIKGKLRNMDLTFAYDCFEFPEEIAKAVSYAVENSVVCKNEDEALNLSGKIKVNCVTFNGSLFKKSGFFSGGLADLEIKAKQWKSNQQDELETERSNLEDSMSSITAEIFKIKKELEEWKTRQEEEKLFSYSIHLLEKKIKDLNTMKLICEDNRDKCLSQRQEVESLLLDLQAKEKELKLEIKSTKNAIFAEFCRRFGIADIGEYEDNTFSAYMEKKQRQADLKKLFLNIEMQMQYAQDQEKDWKRKLEKSSNTFEELKEEQKKASKNFKNLKKVADEYKQNKAEFAGKQETAEKALNKLLSEIEILEKKVKSLEYRMKEDHEKMTLLQSKILHLKIERQTIVKNIRITEGDILPQVPESANDWDVDTVNESSSVDDICNRDFLLKFDYSTVPEEYRNANEAEQSEMLDEMEKSLQNLQKEIEQWDDVSIKNIDKRLCDVKVQIKSSSSQLKTKKAEFKKAQTEFYAVNDERCTKLKKLVEYINDHITPIYRKLTNDPNASLVLEPENQDNFYAMGIKLLCYRSMSPFRSVDELSGGEKTVAALALLCSLQSWKPSVLIMDEIDAALSIDNIRIICKFFKELQNTTQIIAASLSKHFLSKSDVIISILNNPDGKVKMIAVDLGQYQD